MDLSQFIKQDERSWMRGLHGEVYEYIEKEDIAKLLEVKDGKNDVELYAVIASVFKDPKDMYGGFFAKALNDELLLSKNFLPAKTLFDKIYKEADEKLYMKKEIKESEDMRFADFNLLTYRDVTLSFMNDVKPRDLLWQYGETLRLTLNRTQPISLDSIEYSAKHKAICFTYEFYTTIYIPIVLE
jgi:hypothetical protein